ncbi:biosynthetic-type acetolactate synthase large subunit [Pseudobutyrivibrio sp.]|uniref:biosynthetic-type acetolactate synthase large subunit n=1 Tax=Pseudobutyrivibrio sp. TaxID=2014367 RepID=UPI001DF7DB2D|nr:biosynthetic-type acetolactate synthase large subunit [Pseudobutyrivibrio sp.]MBE5912294.1 biosynthetic-type acetolactate synthase large subunit [Pseudobutyrivibrio sp.]
MALNITGRKLFVKALKEEGVDTIFAYPGGMITDIVDELYKTEGIRVILGRHEQALVHEAEGYARATGKTAVVLVTSGPGATNTITGIADAYYDSIPMVIFTGQVPLHLIGNDAFQEVDIVGMTRSITKYGVTVRNRDEMGRLIKMGFQVASTGKPGPVLIDIPKDIQTITGDPEYPSHVDIRGYHPNETVHIGQLKKAYRLLKNASRPLILAGGGVRIAGAQKKLLEFATKMNVPVTTTVMGKGVMPEDSPLYIGNCGMHGRFAANKAVTECDVLFSIGTRFNDRITGELDEFAPKAQIVHVDIASASISRNVVVDVPVTADAKIALERLAEYAEPMKTEEWLGTIRQWENEHPLGMPTSNKIGICPQTICEGINQVFSDANIVTDVGQHQMWASQFIKLHKGQEFITSGGLGTMGFGFPAAIGAAVGNPKKHTLLITGDGGFQMNMQEMATAMTEKIPVVICIFNNSNLGMVRQMQQLFYGKRYEITDLSAEDGNYYPDFVKWADSYNCKAIRVTEPDQVIPALKEAAKVKGAPVVLDFVVSPDDLVLPMVKSGTPLSEMILR